MLNSILLLGSTFNKNNKVLNITCLISWILFMIMGSNIETGMMFVILNLVSFALVFGLGKIFKGKVSNAIVATSSILIWSVTMDVLCYVFYPEFAFGQGLITYVMNGLAFNFKYFLMNVVVVAGAYVSKFVMNKISVLNFEKALNNN